MLWNAAAGSFLNCPLSHGIRRDSSPKVRAKVKRSAAAGEENQIRICISVCAASKIINSIRYE